MTSLLGPCVAYASRTCSRRQNQAGSRHRSMGIGSISPPIPQQITCAIFGPDSASVSSWMQPWRCRRCLVLRLPYGLCNYSSMNTGSWQIKCPQPRHNKLRRSPWLWRWGWCTWPLPSASSCSWRYGRFWLCMRLPFSQAVCQILCKSWEPDSLAGMEILLNFRPRITA